MARAQRPTCPEVTDADLRLAWRDMRRPGWPASFHEAMQDPIRSRLIRLVATHQVRTTAYRKAYPPAASRHEATVLRWMHQNLTDLKRAAAGDRDD
jgi:hypothetical protein